MPRTSSFVFDYSNSQLAKKLKTTDTKLRAALLLYSATKAAEYEAYMKMNRPWVDRTGLAKIRLNTKISQPSNEILRMTLAHGVDYGIWLEVAHEKKYSIIGPTISAKGQDYVSGLRNLFAKVKL